MIDDKTYAVVDLAAGSVLATGSLGLTPTAAVAPLPPDGHDAVVATRDGAGTGWDTRFRSVVRVRLHRCEPQPQRPGMARGFRGPALSFNLSDGMTVRPEPTPERARP